MDSIKGKIEKVDISNGVNRNNKPYKRFVFTINNKKYSTFDENIGNTFKAGDYVEMTGSQKGQFWNMENMRITDPSTDIQRDLNQDDVVLNQDDTLNNILGVLRIILAEIKTLPRQLKNKTE